MVRFILLLSLGEEQINDVVCKSQKKSPHVIVISPALSDTHFVVRRIIKILKGVMNMNS